jgi:hypothetical protein
VTLGNSPDPALLGVWEYYRKSTTVNQYVNPCLKWVEYIQAAGCKPIAVNPFLFATWLTAASLSDVTASPTETRCAAICFSSKAAGVSIVRKLGFKKTSKNPLIKEHVNQIVQYPMFNRTTFKTKPMLSEWH